MMVLRGGLTPGAFPRLRTILFAGEVFPTKYLRQLMELLPHVRFVNLYGPTETNVCTWYEVPTLPEGMTASIPLGKAIADVEVLALADDGGAGGTGEVGELLRSRRHGDARLLGRRRPHGERLVANPAGVLPDRMYRTGDLVQQNVDGDYGFLGRRDSQIKTRGHRVELGDIEAALVRARERGRVRDRPRARRRRHEPDPCIRRGTRRRRSQGPHGLLRRPNPRVHDPRALPLHRCASEDLDRQGRPTSSLERNGNQMSTTDILRTYIVDELGYSGGPQQPHR